MIVETLVHFLIVVVIVAVLWMFATYVARETGGPPFATKIINIACALVLVIVVIYFLLKLVGHPL